MNTSVLGRLLACAALTSAVLVVACRGGGTDPPNVPVLDARATPDAARPEVPAKPESTSDLHPAPPDAATAPPPKLRAPSDHRAAADECDRTPPPPGNPNPKSGGCKSDRDCKEGKNARCRFFPGGHEIAHNYCEYNTCFADDDCKASGKKVCFCGGTGGRGVRSACLGGNCRVDSDCASGFCSPSYGADPMGACGGYAGYYCRTPSDTCVENADCTDGQTCSYQPLLAHWACTANRSCPVG